ncbi:apolipoprotein N-acyltransferase [Solimicrobium silvestre]|uniref:Apolipoprotein N-acyltransferase n=1 Tax=Solimicrobium silvestre TaxID=2099400 RepID=A0A2S9H1A7_9BURK|nr:apolipoprotein N-acyltransferase [Solimicrobium silvestre]PRC93748.1 lnt: apolipoprotein N-acyltransferase [Solimicrobium silvestre]
MQSVISRCPNWVLFLCAFLAGGLNVLAFAPIGYWPLQLLSLSALFCVLYVENDIKKIMKTTWLYCFSWLFFGVIWLTVTMFRYGDMPVWLAVFAVFLFTGAIACIPVLFMGLAARYKAHFSPAVICLVWFPTLWSLAEWTRDWLFTGFPWLVSGYAHNASPLAGYAPIIGVFGITWLTAIFAGSVVLFLDGKRSFSAVAVGIFLLGGALQYVSWTTPSGAPLTVRLLQGNVDQAIKFEQEHLIDSLRFYYDAILKKPADLIVTPESALPLPMQFLPPEYLPDLQKFATQTNSHIALGMFSSDGPNLYANSMIGITPTPQKTTYRYDKHHLVPFGEFIPWGFGWFYHFMNIPMGDQQRGALLAAPFAVKDQQILPNICYEDVFGEEIAAKIAHAYFTQQAMPTILLNMTNLAWFGDSWAMPQHVQITQMRTLEMGRPMLRSTNTGVTTLVNAQGQIVKQLAPFVRGELDVSVQGYQGLTPYIVCGNYLWLGLMSLLALVTACSYFWKKRVR